MLIKHTLSILLIILNAYSEGIQLVRYKIYHSTDISDRVKANLMINAPYSVGPNDAKLSCLVSCNLNYNCLLAALDLKLNICTLFNNQTSLISTISETDVALFSKKELDICPDNDYYADLANSVCIKKKLNEEICIKSEECLESAGLECISGKCQCAIKSHLFYL